VSDTKIATTAAHPRSAYPTAVPHVQTLSSFAALEAAVRTDVMRAFRVATPTLDAFDTLGC
jgi:hypothetical protein